MKYLAQTLVRTACIGLAATIAVAWITALRGPRGVATRSISSRMVPLEGCEGAAWMVTLRQWPGISSARSVCQARPADDILESQTSTMRPESLVPSWASIGTEACGTRASTVPGWQSTIQQTASFGWPFRALSWHRSSDAVAGTITVSLRSGFDLGPVRGGAWPRTLPGAIRWPGFVGNTVLFAGLWLGLRAAYTGGRAGIRAGRGRCIRCGYTVRGRVGCPECGRGYGP